MPSQNIWTLTPFFLQIIEALQHKVEQSHDSDKVRIASEDTLRLIGLALQKRIKDEKYEIVHFPTNPENYLSFCDLTEVVLHPERKMWHTFVMQDQTDVLENLHGMIESVLKFPVRTTKALFTNRYTWQNYRYSTHLCTTLHKYQKSRTKVLSCVTVREYYFNTSFF